MNIRIFDRLLCIFAGGLVVALLLTVTAGIFSRTLNHPLSWTEEVSGFLMIWVACCGWMISTRRNAHIRIRFFQDKLPKQAWRWTEIFIQIGMTLFGAAIAWYSLDLIYVNSDIEALSLPISMAWMYVPMLPAGLVTMFQAVTELADQLKGNTPVIVEKAIEQ
jgi:TRAP-type C4-dicarboxylate transport system permease small subunit